MIHMDDGLKGLSDGSFKDVLRCTQVNPPVLSLSLWKWCARFFPSRKSFNINLMCCWISKNNLSWHVQSTAVSNEISTLQEAIVLPPCVAMAIRPRPGFWEFVLFNVHELSVEQLNVAEYLQFKERLEVERSVSFKLWGSSTVYLNLLSFFLFNVSDKLYLGLNDSKFCYSSCAALKKITCWSWTLGHLIVHFLIQASHHGSEMVYSSLTVIFHQECFMIPVPWSLCSVSFEHTSIKDM